MCACMCRAVYTVNMYVYSCRHACVHVSVNVRACEGWLHGCVAQGLMLRSVTCLI